VFFEIDSGCAKHVPISDPKPYSDKLLKPDEDDLSRRN
jgi:hypothetical protein